MCLKKITLPIQIMITILDLMAQIMRILVWSFDEHDNLHFDNKQGVHRSSQTYEGSGYELHVLSLTILY